MIKTIYLIFSFLAVALVVSSQETKIVKDINDVRHLGIQEVDTTTIEYHPNDVFVSRIICLNAHKMFPDTTHKNEKDTISGYEIHFIKFLRDQLHNYSTTIQSSEDYDKAAYLWTTDTTITVELINSITKKTKSLPFKKVPGWPLWMVY